MWRTVPKCLHSNPGPCSHPGVDAGLRFGGEQERVLTGGCRAAATLGVRKGITVMEMAAMFATEVAAVEWFEELHWPTGEMACLRCGSDQAYRVQSGKPMPYRCKDCKRYFSLKTGTAMEDSKLPLRLWAWAIYLEMTSLKGVSSMKLHRDLGVRQATAWFMLHRIREAFADVALVFDGPVEVDETYIGGLERNKHWSKKLKAGRGPVGKTAVVGMKDRTTKQVAARVIESTDKPTLQGFVEAALGGRCEGLHGRHQRLPESGEPREREAQRGGVRPGAGPHERRGELLEHAQAGSQGGLPPTVREAPPAVRERVCGTAERPGAGHAGPNAGGRNGDGRAAADVPGPDRGVDPWANWEILLDPPDIGATPRAEPRPASERPGVLSGILLRCAWRVHRIGL